MNTSSRCAGGSPDLDLDGAIHAGLRAAFESASIAEFGDSVLESVEHRTGVHPRVQLREPSDSSAQAAAPASWHEGDEQREGRRYEIHGEIAKGGIGVILKGRDNDLGREVAIKVLRNRHSSNPDMLRRFTEEAQIGGQLQHPGILPVYDFGLRPDGKPFFTMKLVRGRTLATLLAARQDPREDQRRFLSIVEHVCQTLAYAHACGVVHRDLKPSNIMVGAFGEVQVMDWGLSKVLSQGGVGDDGNAAVAGTAAVEVETVRRGRDCAHSQAGSVIGTPAYMPPEQARGEIGRLDERSDVFSLGAILCEVLTGSPPYVGHTPEALRRMAAQGDIEDAWARLEESGADAELVRITRWALDLERQSRPRDAGVLARELTGYLASVEERLRQAELSRTAAEARANAERRARRLTVALAGSVLVMAILGGGGYFYVQQQRQARLDDTSRAVNQALREAKLHEGKARVASTGDLTSWDLAIEAAKRAQAAATAGAADVATRSEVASLLQAFTVERKQAHEKAERAQADRRMLAELKRIRDAGLSDADYAKAFLDYGIDVDALTAEEAATSLRASSICEKLTSYLDPWARKRRNARNDKSLHWAKLIDIALLADEDTWRTKMREAVRGRDEAALVDLARSAPVRELPAVTLQLLGEALAAVRRFETAVDLLARAQRRYPDDFWINHALGRSLEQLDPPRWTASVHFRAAAVAIRPDAVRPRVDLSIALRKAGDTDGARAWFDSGLAIDTKKDSYLYLSYRLGDDLGEQDLALEAVEKALEQTPKSPNAWYNKGLSLFQKGELEEAARVFRKAIDLAPTDRAYSNLGATLQRLGRTDDAIAAYRSGIEKNPNNFLLRFNLGALLLDAQRNPRTAVSELAKSLELNAYFPEAHFQLGRALEVLGRWPKAVAEYREAIRLGTPHDKPYLSECYNAIGVWRYQRGDFREAAENFRKAVELRQDSAMAHCNLGNALAKLGKVRDALASYRNALAQDPGYAEANRAMGSLLLNQHDVDEAVVAYRGAVDQESSNPRFLNGLGFALIRNKRYDEAIELLRKAHSIRPDYLLAHSNLGWALQESGRFGEALRTYREVGEAHKDDTGLQRACRQWIGECRRLMELEQKLTRVLAGEQAPVDVSQIIELAEVAAKKQLWAACARLWVAALAADPGLAEKKMWPDNCECSGACALAMAGCGMGGDSGSVDAETRVGWRRQAVARLEQRLGYWKTLLAGGKKSDGKRTVVGALKHWKHDPDLAGLRDETALEKLPESERRACRAFWRAVDALLDEARR